MNPLSKTFRFQFTLRTILVGFAVISLALVVYRWPWEETTDEWAESKTVTTFHRNWDGHKERHGPEKYYAIDDNKVSHLTIIRDFINGEHVSDSWVNDRGVAIAKFHIKDEMPNGPFFDEHMHVHLSGQYQSGARVGDWKYVYKWKGETITVQQQFIKNVPHGKWCWNSSADGELQTVSFQNGRLIEWNGIAASDAIERWFQANHFDASVRHSLAEPIERRWRELKEVESWTGTPKTFAWTLAAPEEQVLLHFPDGDPGGDLAVDPSYQIHERAGRPLLEVLLEASLQESRIPVYRYGVVWIVPIAASELNWRDCSSVSNAKFAVGSSQEAAWQEATVEVTSPESEVVGPDDLNLEWRFQSLFAGTSIQIDASEFGVSPNSLLPIDEETRRSFIFSRSRSLSLRPRSRRDILGFLLSSHNWSCEQRGNVLVLHPYPAEE